MPAFEVAPGDIAVSFPLRGKVMTAGIGIELSDGRVAYFWTFQDQREILDLLAQLGVSVDYEPRRPTGSLSGQWSRAVRGTPTVPLPKPMIPIFMIAVLGVIVLVAVQGSPVGWLAAGLGGVVWMTRSFMFWRRQRQTRSE
jgi:hypothetical protein